MEHLPVKRVIIRADTFKGAFKRFSLRFREIVRRQRVLLRRQARDFAM